MPSSRKSPASSKIPLESKEESKEEANLRGIPERVEAGAGLHRGGFPQERGHEVPDAVRLDEVASRGAAQLLEVGDVGGRLGALELLAEYHEAGRGLASVRQGEVGPVASGGARGEAGRVFLGIRGRVEGEFRGLVTETIDRAIRATMPART